METNELNVLLLGETGAGKSTFVNALLNYSTHQNLDQAAEGNLSYFVPTKFSMLDDDFRQKTVCVGCSPDENQMVAASATQKPKTYSLNWGSHALNLIDTPGIGDTRGMEHDKTNTDKLMHCISQMKHLNAICVVLKPDITRLSAQFEYCFNQILSKLDRRVQSNIIFVFTHARSNSGGAVALLELFLRKIPNVTIRPNKENTFHVENDPFRYLAAVSCGVRFDQKQVRIYQQSWNGSSETCKSLVDYVSRLRPVPIQGTVMINEARRVVAILAQPVAEMLMLYDEAVDRLKQHEFVLTNSQNAIAVLKENLYIPTTEFRVTQVIKTTTQTSSNSWSTGLSFSVRPPFVFFNIGFDRGDDVQTNTQEVMESFEVQIEDASIKVQLEHTQNAADVAALKISEINSLIDEYGVEAETILGAVVEFSTFLEENAIVPYGDLFLKYFQHLLERESNKESDADDKRLKNLCDLLDRYTEKKRGVSGVSPADIIAAVERLKRLEHCGLQIGHFHNKALEDNPCNTAA